MRREAVVSDRPAGPGNFSQRLGSQGLPSMDSMQPLRRREEMVLPPDLPMWRKVSMRVGSGISTLWERLMSGSTEGVGLRNSLFWGAIVISLLLKDDSGWIATEGDFIWADCKSFTYFFSDEADLMFMVIEGLLTEPGF